MRADNERVRSAAQPRRRGQPESVAASAPENPTTDMTTPTQPQIIPALAIPAPETVPADRLIIRPADRPNARPARPSRTDRIANAPATRAPHPSGAPLSPRHTMPSATTIDAIPAINAPIARPDVTGGTFTYAYANGVPPTGCSRAMPGGRGGPYRGGGPYGGGGPYCGGGPYGGRPPCSGGPYPGPGGGKPADRYPAGATGGGPPAGGRSPAEAGPPPGGGVVSVILGRATRL
jgi:translation initiation factor IF-2